MTKKSEALIAIDLVRFGCAALVMTYHLMSTHWQGASIGAASLLAGIKPLPSWVVAGMRFNWIGVQLFFVISGMVIARSALAAPGGEFMRRRILRLVPAAFICATISAAALIISGADMPNLFARWLASVTLLPFGGWIDPSYWTLGIELIFYLAVACFFSLNRNGGTDRFAAIFVFACAAFWMLVLAQDPHAPAFDEHGLFYTLLPHGAFFALGMLLTSAARSGWTARKLALFGGALCLAAVQIARHARWLELRDHVPMAPAVPLTIFLVGMAVLASTRTLQPRLERIIAPSTARTIGVATYPLYLIHYQVGAALTAAFVALGIATGVAVALTIASVLGLTACIATCLEPPVRSILRGAFQRFGDLPVRFRTATVSSRGR
ncbi:MAG: acyltransferase [Sphingomonas sp.]|uniref:acyltransferase family protein n=1 Tax=Sphingomonas sp. TaxID=28214 RepID=UPI001B1D8480|nr:acyltransferase [Sphingomonas sp.]MBO9624190.1 acyltransferase [Sphingomonas sp.]